MNEIIPLGQNMFAGIEGDEVWPGIFYIETNPEDPKPQERVGALAFMIRADGLLVTCAHVAGRPGHELILKSAVLPVAIRARVLEEGWSGPAPNRWGQPLRPEEYKADVAFLRLLPDTAIPIAHAEKTFLSASEARGALYAGAKVLSLGSPNYSVRSKQPLDVFQVTYSPAGFPRQGSGIATFRAVEPSLNGGTVALDSKVIRPGDSGGPVWDKERRRVVAMVRRGLGYQEDSEFAADARSISRLSGVPLRIDADAQAIVCSLDSIAKATSLMRHFPILQNWMDGSYIELSVAPLASRNMLSDMTTPVNTMPASDGVLKVAVARKAVFLLGGPGAGKSRLIYHLCRRLLDYVVVYNGKRVLPLIFHAQDFQAYGLNIRDMVRMAAKRTDLRLTSERSPLEVLSTNDVALMVLIDGLDEISEPARVKLIRQVTEKMRGTGRPQGDLDDAYNDDVFLVVASRPVEDILVAHEGQGPGAQAVLELQPLNADEIDRIISSRIEDEARRKSVREMIDVLAWAQEGPTPLQLAVALGFATAGDLEPDRPARPVDLNFRLIDHLIALGLAEDSRHAARDPVGRTSGKNFLAENLRTLLQILGENFIAGAATLEENCQKPNFVIEGRSNLAADIRDFVMGERRLLSAILAVDSDESGRTQLIWPHRTIPEALAAEYHASSALGHTAAFTAYQALLRERRSSAFELQFLSLIDRRDDDRDDCASQLVSLKLEREHKDVETMWFALRLLAAGIVVRDDVSSRLVTILIKVLTSVGDSVWERKCSSVFSMSSAPSPIAVAQLPSVRPFLLEKLNGILERRARVTGVARLTPKEDELIERLSLRHALTVPTVAPRLSPGVGRPFFSGSLAIDNTEMRTRNSGKSGESALVTFALRLLAKDPDGFARAFNAFLERQPRDADPAELLHSFIAEFSRQN